MLPFHIFREAQLKNLEEIKMNKNRETEAYLEPCELRKEKTRKEMEWEEEKHQQEKKIYKN